MSAVLLGSHQGIDISVQRTTGGVFVNTQKESCESTIGNVAKFIIEKDGRSSALLGLSTPPLSLSELKEGVKLIKDHPLIHIVPDEVNRDNIDGGIFITRRITIGINDNQMIGLVGQEALMLARRQRRAELEILGISQTAWGKVEAHTQNMERTAAAEAAAAKRAAEVARQEAERQAAQRREAELARKKAEKAAAQKRAQEEARKRAQEEEAAERRAQEEATRKKAELERDRAAAIQVELRIERKKRAEIEVRLQELSKTSVKPQNSGSLYQETGFGNLETRLTDLEKKNQLELQKVQLENERLRQALEAAKTEASNTSAQNTQLQELVRRTQDIALTLQRKEEERRKCGCSIS